MWRPWKHLFQNVPLTTTIGLTDDGSGKIHWLERGTREEEVSRRLNVDHVLATTRIFLGGMLVDVFSRHHSHHTPLHRVDAEAPY